MSIKSYEVEEAIRNAYIEGWSDGRDPVKRNFTTAPREAAYFDSRAKRDAAELGRKAGEPSEESKRAYDIMVTSPDCCSCHINPPCSFCTSQSEEEAQPTTENER